MIKAEFETGANAAALSWMNKEQTNDKLGDFVFSQSEFCYGRSIFLL